MILVNEISENDRISHLAVAAFLLLFLVQSDSHRVHQFIYPAQEKPCMVSMGPEDYNLRPTSGASLPILQKATKVVCFSLEVWISYLTPSPFSKRAPPST